MARMAAMPIYSIFLKILLYGTNASMTLKFVFFFGIVYSSITKDVQIMSRLILCENQIWSLRHLYVKIIIIVIIIINGNYCTLMSQSWLKHSTKLANEVK